MIQYHEGDLFQNLPQTPVVIPHVCNNKGAWGAGFVIPLAKHFPEAKNAYLNSDPVLGMTQIVSISNIHVANMVAQTLGGKRPLFYNHLAQCMSYVANATKELNVQDIHAPMFGAGLAGGNWLFIEELILDTWINANINVTIHYLANSIPGNWSPPNA